jgi:hypothetical protein
MMFLYLFESCDPLLTPFTNKILVFFSIEKCPVEHNESGTFLEE